MKRIIFFVFIVNCAVFSQNKLEQFINAALKNNPTIKEHENARQIIRLDNDLFRAENILPKISLTANYQFFPYFNNGGQLVTANPGPDAVGYDIGITNGGFYSAQLNLEKNLFNGGLIEALQNQNTVAEKTVSNNILVEEHNITKQVTDQYLAALQSQLNLSLANEIRNNLANQMQFTKALVEKGLAKQPDFLLLQIEEGNQKIEIARIYVEFKNNLAALYSMCGIKDTQTINLENASLVKSQAETGSSFLSKYDEDSLALSAQQKVLETKYLPQLKVFFNTGLNAVELKGIQNKFGMSAGIDFSLPIYDGSQKEITRQQNIIGLKTINNYKNYFITELQSRRISADALIEITEQNLTQINRQLKSYESILAIKKGELEHGQISMIEYLTILRNYIDQKKNQIAAQIDYQIQINNYNYWNW